MFQIKRIFEYFYLKFIVSKSSRCKLGVYVPCKLIFGKAHILQKKHFFCRTGYV